MSNLELNNLRLDKWLWAARFFKTRNLAKSAIEKGQVLYDGQRPKVSRIVNLGAKLTITQGWAKKEIEVLGLASQRGPAPQAQLLYAETPESLKLRAAQAEQHKYNALLNPLPQQKPNKKSRRELHNLKRQES